MAWKNIPEKKVLATLKEKSALKGTVSEKFDIYVDGAVPGGEGDVQGISMTIDPSTYVMTTQLKDGKGGNVGSPATIDLPLESMVVSGEYDEENKSIILTLKNGQTVEFSVADLVSGLQSEITLDNPLSADLVAETANKNFVTSEEKDDIDTIPGLTAEIDDVRQALDDKQDIIDENNPLNANYIDDENSDKKLVTSQEKEDIDDIQNIRDDIAEARGEIEGKQDIIDETNPLNSDYIDDSNSDKKLVNSMDLNRLEQLPEISADPYRINFQDSDGNEISIEINNVSRGGVTSPLSYTVTFNGEPLTGSPIYHALREADCNYNSDTIILETLDPGLYLLDDYSMGMGVTIYVDSERTNVVTGRRGIWLVEPHDRYSHMYYFPQEDSYSAEGMVIFTLENGEAVSDVEVATKADINNLQPAINQANKLSADYIAETNNNKIMTSAERTKLAGIATGAEVNVQSDWNVTNSSSDAFIKNKPTNVSAFTNDSGYQNASQVSSAIASAVGEITSFEFEIVQTLPASGEAGVVYLVPNSGTTPNIYDEYIWVNNEFEKIGTTDIDLSGYATTQDLEDGLATKADAIDPSDLPSGSTQNGVITTNDHTDIDPSVVSEGQIVVDSTENKVYIISEITTDPQTGDPVIVWKEIQTDEEIVYANMTITDVQAMTFVVNDYTATEIHDMLNAGMSVFYRLTLPQAVGGLAPGVYDFRPLYHTNGAVMSSLSGSVGNNTLLGIAYHADVGTSHIEMRFLQNQIDSNNKLSADLIDSSSSDDKTYQTGTGAPTTSTAGSVGEMYVDKSTGTVYVCTSTTGGSYTWNEVSGGDSGAIITMTSTDPGEGVALEENHFIAVYEV